MDTFEHVDLAEGTSAQALFEQVRAAQERHVDGLTCSQRRARRMPFELRALYTHMRSCSHPERLEELKRTAWVLRKKWMADLRLAGRMRAVSRGRALQRSRKLHKIEAMNINGVSTIDREEWAAEIKKYYEEKWGCTRLQDRLNILDRIRRYDDVPFEIQMYQVSDAFLRMRKKFRNDANGICVAGLEMLYAAQPVPFKNWLQSFLSSSWQFSSLNIAAYINGKESKNTSVSKTRVIMPLPALLNLIDCLLVVALEPYMEEVL